MSIIDLSGDWKLGFFKEKSENNYTDTLRLPGTVSEQKKSPATGERALGYLTDPYAYTGQIFLQKEIKLEPNQNKRYYLELERTRVSTLWINDNLIGEKNSLTGRHIYDISNYVERNIIITIKLDNENYPTKGGHLTSPDTQTNWLGVCGFVGIRVKDKDHLDNTQIYTEFSASKVILKVTTEFKGDDLKVFKFVIPDVLNKEKQLRPGENTVAFLLPKDVKLWSDTTPNLYTLTISSEDNPENSESFTIGFRNFKVNKTHFEINGKKIFLRGKHDGLIFPETGYAPTDEASWLKVMTTAKNYGINHYRFHTCCPPNAAFSVADKLGIYMSPELPFWGTIEESTNEAQKDEQAYLINEGFEISKNFGNHPCFVMMSMGNELWGSEKRIDEIISMLKKKDYRHLYTGGSNNFQFVPKTTENEDYWVGVRFSTNFLIRGSYAQCDAPLGFIQTDMPNTVHNFDVFFQKYDVDSTDTGPREIEIQYGTGTKKVIIEGGGLFLPNKPCISHETGQFCMYPDLDEIKRYTGVLKPYNFEQFKEKLENAGMGSLAKNFFRDSSRLSVQCYKNELEAFARSEELSGYQILDIQDFTGQGTAVVGILNAFMETKNILTEEEWRSFCGEIMLLASFEKYVYTEGDFFSAKIILHNYSEKDLKGKNVVALVIDTENNNKILYVKKFLINENLRGNQNLGTLSYFFTENGKFRKIALKLVLDDSSNSIKNNYTLHVYPKPDSNIQNILYDFSVNDTIELEKVVLTKNPLHARANAESGKNVIYFPTDFTDQETVEGTYCTDFWCYPMFRSISESMNKKVPVGTLGLTIKNDSLLLKDFPCDTFTTPNWYNLVNHATCVNLGKEDADITVQMIDNFERNWRLGLLYKKDGMVVCTIKVWEVKDETEVNCFLKSLINSFN